MSHTVQQIENKGERERVESDFFYASDSKGSVLPYQTTKYICEL